MTYQEETRPCAGAGQVVSRRASDTPQNTRPAGQKQTQVERVLAMLMESDECCSTDFIRQYLPRFSVAIHKLRKQSFVIDKHPCVRHFHESTQWAYVLVAVPFETPSGQIGLLGKGAGDA